MKCCIYKLINGARFAIFEATNQSTAHTATKFLSSVGKHKPGQSPQFSLISPPRSQSFPGLASLILPAGLLAREISLPVSKRLFHEMSV